MRVSFVDVPGHERFVRNMLAGAGGIEAVLLVVAADESVMPQTREHFEIVRMLGLRDRRDRRDQDRPRRAGARRGDRLRRPGADARVLSRGGADRAGLRAHGRGPRGPEGGSSGSRPAGAGREPRGRASRGSRSTAPSSCRGSAPSSRAASSPERSRASRSWSSCPTALRARAPRRGARPRGGSRARGRACQREPGRASSSRTCAAAWCWRRPSALRHVDARPREAGAAARRLRGSRAAIGCPFITSPPRRRAGVRVLDAAEIRRRWLGAGGSCGFGRPVAAAPGDRFVVRRLSPVETIGGGVVLDPLPRGPARQAGRGPPPGARPPRARLARGASRPLGRGGSRERGERRRSRPARRSRRSRRCARRSRPALAERPGSRPAPLARPLRRRGGAGPLAVARGGRASEARVGGSGVRRCLSGDAPAAAPSRRGSAVGRGRRGGPRGPRA